MERNSAVQRFKNAQIELESLGTKPKLGDKIIFGLDALWCSDTQLPATDYIKMGGDFQIAKKIATRRILNGITTFGEPLGLAIFSFGVSEASPTKIIGALGLLNKIGSSSLSMHIKNQSGQEWRGFLEKNIDQIMPYKNILYSYLSSSGFASEEITKFESMPTATYLAEIRSATETRISKLISPIFSALALIAFGNPILAGTILIAGLSTLPISEKIYRESDKKRSSESRAGKSAKNDKFLNILNLEHLHMTDKTNLLSQADEIAISLILLATNGGNLLANVSGARLGLKGYYRMLTLTREREESRRDTEMMSKIIEHFGSSNYILTPKRWREHVNKKTTLTLENHIPKGVVIKDFSTNLPGNSKTEIQPVNLEIQSGEITILKAKSGLGKSVFLAGLMHIFEHEGNIWFFENGKPKNIHDFATRDKAVSKILHLSTDTINPNDSIVDLFAKDFNSTHPELLIYKKEGDQRKPKKIARKPKHSDEILWNVGINMSNSLLLAEIKKFEKGEEIIFPKKMIPQLIDFREKRINWTNTLLHKSGGNLSKENISGDRVFSSLSSGEKQRIVVLSAKIKTENNPEISFLILDEPLAQLDREENLPLQLQTIKAIQESKNAPAIAIISHQYLDEMQKELNAKIVNLEKNGN